MEHTVNRPRPIPNATFVPVQPRRRFTFITQSPHARVPLSLQPQVAQPVSTALPTRTSPLASASVSPAAEESPLVAACRRYAQQYGGLGKRADADTAADAPTQGDGADDQESPLVRAAKKRAQQAQQAQTPQQR